MAESLKELLQKRAELVAKARGTLDRAEKEGRNLNSEERAECDKLDADIDALSVKIDAKRYQQDQSAKLAKLEATFAEETPRQVPPSRPGSTPTPRGDEGASLSMDFGRAGCVQLRAGSQEHTRAQPAYSNHFASYLRGDRRDWDSLGLVQSSDPKGGYLAPMAFVSQLIKFLDDMVMMRQLGTVLPPTTAKSVGALSYDTDLADADWTAEVPASDYSEDDAARFGSREMTPHMLAKLVKASMKLIRSSTLPIENFLAQRLAYKFAVTEEKAFLTGSGSQRPLGVFVASDLGIPTSRDRTCASATAFTADELIDATFDLKDAYRAKATWLCHRDFVRRARKLKDGNGQYLWTQGLSGTPDTILERPVRASEYAPSTFTTGQYVAMFADFSHYWIQDGLGLEVQRLDELFSLRNQVGWIARKETDAQPVLAEAFVRLKLG